ncbi:MAG TPA: Hsp20/alpha crystallin family protein [Mycobacteriales bacterium]|jgi:HSP20 family protein|nr:Hsp20/alpha crystallin family protein [Mycobacteriales bacterium]
MLLERIDPFLAEFDRLAQRTLGTADGVGLPMDIVRSGDDLVVHMDLPGVKADEVKITLENRTLTISAPRRSTYGEGDQVLVQERFDGEISRRVRVPEWVDADSVAADYVDGVLTVRLPLAERAKPRVIAVNGSATPAEIES